MDPISQGALGAVTAAGLAPPKNLRLAALAGWAGGMLADMDVVIRSSSDPLLNIEYHRHFTHSLIFIPIGALLCAGFLWPFVKRNIDFKHLFLYSFFGYATAGLLDTCTSYGTHLLWPFSDERTAWNIISIVDPVFTGTILALILVGWIKRQVHWSRAALGFVAAYLLLGAVQNRRATTAVMELAEARGHGAAVRFTVKPSLGNLMLWRGIYEIDNLYHVDAFRIPYLGSHVVVFEGDVARKVDTEAIKTTLPDNSVLAEDLDRFARFSDGYLAWHPTQADVIGDVRYAMLPDSVNPLWGIRIDRDRPYAHAAFENFRITDRSQRSRFLEMLLPNRGRSTSVPPCAP